MSRLTSTHMSWSERLALMRDLKLTDFEAVQLFEVDIDELLSAKRLKAAGVIRPLKKVSLDHDTQLEPFLDRMEAEPMFVQITHGPVPFEKPKIKKIKKSKGCKGTRIMDAFSQVPELAVPAEEFAKTHQISINVLRQSGRLDKTGIPGKIRCRQDKETGVLMVWRDKNM